jgi:hypothetical protein
MTEETPLPEDGPALIGGVPLPAGQRIYGWDNEDDRNVRPVAWVTSHPVADAGYAWLALSDAHPLTGLVPVLVSRAGDMPGIDGEAFMFSGPEDVGLIDSMSAADVLTAGWEISEEEFDDYWAGQYAPFGREFPGLAPPQQERLPMAVLHQAVATEQPAFLALVAAARAADVPAAVGWTGFGVDRPGTPEAHSLAVAAVLRSWQARFGARPLRMGSDMILRVLVERPPVTMEAAIAVAAEHRAFADEYGRFDKDQGSSGQSIRELAAELAEQPIWHFRWD